MTSYSRKHRVGGLLFVLTVAAVARVLAWRSGPFLYPDAYFQYLEPAWKQISGVGVQTWEWWVGLRSWLLPGYHGAWMALLSRLGVPGDEIGRALKLHWGILSLSMVWAAYRAGASLSRQATLRALRACSERLPGIVHWPDAGHVTGLFTAFLVGSFPLLALYSVETLSETPSMIAIVSGLCFTAELVEARDRADAGQAFLIGVVSSLGVCLRVVNAPLAVVAPIWLLACGPRRMLLPMCAGAFMPILLAGSLDRITWGNYFQSFIGYIKFNLIQGRAADFGTQPVRWYWDKLLARQPICLGLVGVIALIGIRDTWPFVLGAVGTFALLSSQAHKEERFIVIVWPLLLIAAGVAAGRWLQQTQLRQPSKRPLFRWRVFRWRVFHWCARILDRVRTPAVLGGSVFLLWEALAHLGKHDLNLTRARLDAQVFVAHRPSVSGLLTDWNLYTGGYLWFDRTLPLVNYRRELLENPLFSHVLVAKRHGFVRIAPKHGFVPVWDRDSVTVFERRSPPKSGPRTGAK